MGGLSLCLIAPLLKKKEKKRTHQPLLLKSHRENLKTTTEEGKKKRKGRETGGGISKTSENNGLGEKSFRNLCAVITERRAIGLKGPYKVAKPTRIEGGRGGKRIGIAPRGQEKMICSSCPDITQKGGPVVIPGELGGNSGEEKM